MSERPNTVPDPATVMQALPGLVRIAAGAYWRTTGWTLTASVRAGDRVIRAAASGESVADLLAEAGDEVRGYLRELLGIIDPDDRLGGVVSRSGGRGEQPTAADERAEARGSLRERGAELLRQSADVRFEEHAHPAYARILGELAPDEGRILRLLALEGPQPAVDVRMGKTFVPGSQLVAPGLSMLGPQAGCRYLDRVPAYLNNLFRLGLIWFSREALEDPLRYQVLEAQPEVLEAMRGSGRGKTVRRSIQLTPFGEDFCETCLPLHTAELDALPGGAENPPLAGPAAERAPERAAPRPSPRVRRPVPGAGPPA